MKTMGCHRTDKNQGSWDCTWLKFQKQHFLCAKTVMEMQLQQASPAIDWHPMRAAPADPYHSVSGTKAVEIIDGWSLAFPLSECVFVFGSCAN